jgi:CBS-domain-containing membrane protein
MDVTETAARVAALKQLDEDIQVARDELRQIDKHSSEQAAQRHRALTEQLKIMLPIREQNKAALDDYPGD